MNIHPLFVHFPIALLTLYALMVLMPLGWRKNFIWWKGASKFIVIVGWIAALPTAATGGIAEELVKDKIVPGLIEKHSMFAGIVLLIFFLFFSAQLVQIFANRGWGEKIGSKSPLLMRVWGIKLRFASIILSSRLTKPLALLGLIALVFTGALGAAIAYGPDIDPFVHATYMMFFSS